MSEHMEISSKIDYWHLPSGEEWGFTYCKHCKETCEKASVEFHQGMDDWINLRCGKCKKSIWTAIVKRKQTKDNKKCAICKKPTNWIDCESYGGGLSNKTEYWCSKKCYKKQNKMEEEKSGI